MIEIAGFLYALSNDVVKALQYREEEKLVEIRWPEISGLQSEAEERGVKLSWSRPEKVESRLLQGYEIIYEVDKINRVKRKLVLRDGLVLIARQIDSDAT